MGNLHPFWQFWYRENDDSIGVWQVKTGSWPTQKLVLTRFDQQMASLKGLAPTKGTVYALHTNNSGFILYNTNHD
jgi:hypothetical protein